MPKRCHSHIYAETLFLWTIRKSPTGMLLKGDDPWSCGPRRSWHSCPYRRRMEGDDSLQCESQHDSPQVQDSNAKQSLKELHAFGKRHALARTSLQEPHPRKGNSRSSRNLIVYRWSGPSKWVIHHPPPSNAECGARWNSGNVVVRTSERFISYSHCPSLHRTLSESKGEAFHWVGWLMCLS
jgi:hypothetical protein